MSLPPPLKKTIQVGDKGSDDYINSGNFKKKMRYLKWVEGQGKNIEDITKPTFWSVHFSNGEYASGSLNAEIISRKIGREVVIENALRRELEQKANENTQKMLTFIDPMKLCECLLNGN